MFKRTYGSGLSATIICASLVLSACGGGGGSGGSSSSGGDASTLKAGLYEAKVEYVNGASSQTAVTYLSPAGDFTSVFRGGAGVSIGKLAFDTTRISGVSSDYRQLGPEQLDPTGFVEDKGTQEGTINGTISSQGSATFSTTDAADQVNTNVTLQRQNLISDVGISLKRTSGTYVKGESEVALTIGADGSLDAQYYTQTTGCQLVGIEALSVPDASINVFDINYTMSNCTNDNRNGEYSGVGYFIPMNNQQMRVVFATHNGKVAMRFSGAK
ncbi:hypothetical protein [Marinobacter halophilus]|uniref:Lipoprotein n=1 Tax=Marinobacter halophilus TaxID=1323740 RepID=A0A2T1KDM1_9GAMM|nr:hypothetical protein [Marinobacter halophilus]PSF07642.1 hypothetical protein C7H08_12160 [Marinobacter halophilus]GGC56070.1 hypothetical protein GCM10011362_00400 [Marinobacter halophilus]